MIRKPPHPDLPLPAELLERLIDTMTAFESIESDFQAAKIQMEIIANIVFEMTHPSDANSLTTFLMVPKD